MNPGNALSRQAVNMGGTDGLASRATQVAIAQVIRENDNDLGPRTVESRLFFNHFASRQDVFLTVKVQVRVKGEAGLNPFRRTAKIGVGACGSRADCAAFQKGSAANKPPWLGLARLLLDRWRFPVHLCSPIGYGGCHVIRPRS